jgi:uncharacterized membrane protein YhaH (DUF805 family)
VSLFQKWRARSDSASQASPENTSPDPAQWHWSDQTSDATLQRMAEVSLPLILNPNRWIHRRVEKIEFIDRQTIRRQVSVDFTLPTNVTPVGRFEGRDVYLAPLFLLKRDHPRPLRLGREPHWWMPWRPEHPPRLPMSLFSDLTFMDERGRRLPLITRRQSTGLANAILYQAAAQATEKPLSDEVTEKIADIAFGNRRLRKDALKDIFVQRKKLDTERLRLRDAAFFAELASMFASHLPIACLLTDGPPGRSIVKLSYIEPLGQEHSASKGKMRRSIGLKSENLAAGINEIGGASSHHIEVVIPNDLQVNYLSLTGKSYTLANRNWHELNDEEKDYSIRQVGTASSGNIYLSEPPLARRMGRISIKMRVKRTGFLIGALVASSIITLVLAVMALMAPDIVRNTNSGTLVAVLLLLPSIVAAFIARPGEHMITSRMLRWARFALVANAALPFLAVLAFLTTRAEDTGSPGIRLGGFVESVLGLMQSQDSPAHGLQGRWGWLAVLSLGFSLLFLAANILPRPHGESHYSPLANDPGSDTSSASGG